MLYSIPPISLARDDIIRRIARERSIYYTAKDGILAVYVPCVVDALVDGRAPDYTEKPQVFACDGVNNLGYSIPNYFYDETTKLGADHLLWGYRRDFIATTWVACLDARNGKLVTSASLMNYDGLVYAGDGSAMLMDFENGIVDRCALVNDKIILVDRAFIKQKLPDGLKIEDAHYSPESDSLWLGGGVSNAPSDAMKLFRLHSDGAIEQVAHPQFSRIIFYSPFIILAHQNFIYYTHTLESEEPNWQTCDVSALSPTLSRAPSSQDSWCLSKAQPAVRHDQLYLMLTYSAYGSALNVFLKLGDSHNLIDEFLCPTTSYVKLNHLGDTIILRGLHNTHRLTQNGDRFGADLAIYDLRRDAFRESSNIESAINEVVGEFLREEIARSTASVKGGKRVYQLTGKPLDVWTTSLIHTTADVKKYRVLRAIPCDWDRLVVTYRDQEDILSILKNNVWHSYKLQTTPLPSINDIPMCFGGEGYLFGKVANAIFAVDLDLEHISFFCMPGIAGRTFEILTGNDNVVALVSRHDVLEYICDGCMLHSHRSLSLPNEKVIAGIKPSPDGDGWLAIIAENQGYQKASKLDICHLSTKSQSVNVLCSDVGSVGLLGDSSSAAVFFTLDRDASSINYTEDPRMGWEMATLHDLSEFYFRWFGQAAGRKFILVHHKKRALSRLLTITDKNCETIDTFNSYVDITALQRHRALFLWEVSGQFPIESKSEGEVYIPENNGSLFYSPLHNTFTVFPPTMLNLGQHIMIQKFQKLSIPNMWKTK